MELTSTAARERYDALAAHLSRTVIGLDFDGVLSPIVDDPAGEVREAWADLT